MKKHIAEEFPGPDSSVKNGIQKVNDDPVPILTKVVHGPAVNDWLTAIQNLFDELRKR